MAIEIVDMPIEQWWFSIAYVSLTEGTPQSSSIFVSDFP